MNAGSPRARAIRGGARAWRQTLALHQRGILSDAEKIYGEILRRQPSHFDALNLLVNYDKAIALKPDYAEAHNNRGVALYDLRRYDAALSSYDKTIVLNRNYAEAYNNRGVTLRDLRRYEEALVSYDKAIALQPGLADGQWNKSVCLLQVGRFERGWTQYEWRRKLDPPLTSRAYSMDLATLLPALRDDAEWICLQKKLNAEDATLLARDGDVTLVELRDFSDTAALVDLMDVVITVDTSVTHLAGAMGKPVWILLAYNSDWRWLADRRDSPWYPSAHLFRQQEIGNWGDVISQVRRELHGVIDGGVRA
jgi:tetratricopeptide (TPR) repeat protein